MADRGWAQACAGWRMATWALTWLIAASGAAAQTPLAVPTFQTDDAVRFELRAASSIEQGPTRYSLEQRAVLRCQAAEEQPPERLFLCSFESLEISRRAGEASERFAWDKDAPEAQHPGDKPSALALVNAALAQSTLRVWVDRNGEASRVEGYGDAAKALAQAPEAEGAIMGALSPASVASNLSPIFGGDLPSAGEGDAAETWTRTRTVSAGPGRTLVMTTTWRQGERKGDRAALTGATTVQMKQDSPPGALAAEVRLSDVDAGVETSWDAAAHRLIERRSFLRMTTQMTMGEIALTQRLDSQVSLRTLPSERENP